MSGIGASAALLERAAAALAGIAGLAVYRGPPVQAAAPYALVATGPERDWSWKGGGGRELRLAVTLHDRGESPARLLRIAAAAEAALAGIGGEADGWRAVSLAFVRSELVPPRRGAPDGLWARMLEYRVRVEAL